MPNSNYVNGRAKEYATIKTLKEQGYNAVRMAGSHGFADVIAWNNIHIRFIQVKKQNKPNDNIDSLYGDDVAKIKKEIVPPNSKKELWVYANNKGYKIYEID